MATGGKERQLRWPWHQTGDSPGKFLGTVLIPFAMHGKNRTANPAKMPVERPGSECRREPYFRPRLQHPPRLIAVPPRQSGKLLLLPEGILCRPDTGQGALLDERLGGLGDDRLTAGGMQSGDGQS